MTGLPQSWRAWAYATILVMVCLLSVTYYQSAVAHYRETHDDLLISTDLAHEIVELHKQPAAIRAQAMEQLDLVRRIETAARDCKISDKSLDRITPDAPHRLAGTEYEERPVQIQLRQVTMAQLLPFLYRIGSDTDGLNLKSCRISAPRGEESGDTWRVEVGASYLIYSPQDSHAR